MKNKEKLNIGVIGMGKMGLLHASVLNSMPGVEVSSIFDKSRILKQFAGKALKDILVVDSFNEFIKSRYDAVYVTTPIPTHFSIIDKIFSLEVSENIFVEKTLCSSYGESAMACQEAKIIGGTNMVGYMSRFAVTFQKAMALLQEGIIGTPVSFNAYAYASDFADSQGKPSHNKGSVTRDLGAHVIDLSLWFFGELKVESIGNIDENNSNFKVRNINGLTGEFDVSWSKVGYRLPEFGLTVNGAIGRISVNPDSIQLDLNNKSAVWHRQDFDDRVPFLLGASEYYRENQHFINAIRNGVKAEPNFISAAKVDLLIDDIESHTRE